MKTDGFRVEQKIIQFVLTPSVNGSILPIVSNCEILDYLINGVETRSI